MSVEKVNKRKEEKKNRKKNEIRYRRKQKLVSAVCIGMVAIMLISPALIYIADISNRDVNTQISGDASSDSGIYDPDGNLIGYVDASGNTQLFSDAELASDSNIEIAETEAIYDEDGNQIGHRHADGSEHLDAE